MTRATPQPPAGTLHTPVTRIEELLHSILWELQSIRDNQTPEALPSDFPSKSSLEAVGHTTLAGVATLTTAMMVAISGIGAVSAAAIRAELVALGYTPAAD